jgi:hypothetical protein
MTIILCFRKLYNVIIIAALVITLPSCFNPQEQIKKREAMQTVWRTQDQQAQALKAQQEQQRLADEQRKKAEAEEQAFNNMTKEQQVQMLLIKEQLRIAQINKNKAAEAEARENMRTLFNVVGGVLSNMGRPRYVICNGWNC